MSMHEETGHPPADSGAVWQAVRDHLDQVRLSLHAQIHDYPRPVAGCDQQFNYLLEKRAAIGAEIGRLDTLRRSPSGQELRRFVEGSAFLDDAARRRFCAGLLALIS